MSSVINLWNRALFCMITGLICWITVISVDDSKIMGLVIGCLMGILIFASPSRYLVYIIFFYATVINLLTRRMGFLPLTLLWGSDCLIGFLVIKSLWMRFQHRQTLLPASPINELLFIFIVCCVISTLQVGNSTIPIRLLLGLRAYLKYMIMFYAILVIEPLKISSYKIFRLLLAMCLTSPILAMFERFVWGWPGDKCGGWMDTGSFAIIGSCMVIWCFCDMYHRPIRLSPVACIIAVAVTCLVGQIRLPFFLVPFIMSILYYRKIFRKMGYALAMISLIIIFGSIAWFAPNVFIMGEITEFVEAKRFVTYVTVQYDGPELNRLPAVRYAIQQVSESIESLLFGYGLLHASASSVFGSLGNKAIVALKVYPYQASKTLLEVGWIGLITYFLILVRLFIFSLSGKKRTQGFEAGTLDAFRGIVLVYVLCVCYNDLWTLDATAMFFWMIAGLVVQKIISNKLPEKEACV